MTADTALRLGLYFGMAAEFWMNPQTAYELDLARRQSGKAIQRIPNRNARLRGARRVLERHSKGELRRARSAGLK
jgi:plasmid maintenance system antidote protein VapI